MGGFVFFLKENSWNASLQSFASTVGGGGGDGGNVGAYQERKVACLSSL